MERASGQVFLRVLHDALFSSNGGSNLLLPLKDLSALLPEPAIVWLTQHGASVQMASRVQQISQRKNGWQVEADGLATMDVDAIILACPALEAARLVDACDQSHSLWIEHVKNLSYEPITTVYGMASGTRLAQPMLALPSSSQYPAQFVFDRGQLGGPAGLLAFVISASSGDSKTLTQQVLAQAVQQLGLTTFEPIKTIIEKRATFACTPNLIRPAMQIGPGLLACGDYIAGPYPATLEGAVRSGLAAARAISS
jgi:predicted NAD/FAD-dependent oxidoreductase